MRFIPNAANPLGVTTRSGKWGESKLRSAHHVRAFPPTERSPEQPPCRGEMKCLMPVHDRSSELRGPLADCSSDIFEIEATAHPKRRRNTSAGSGRRAGPFEVLSTIGQIEKPHERWSLYRRYERLLQAAAKRFVYRIPPFDGNDREAVLGAQVAQYELDLQAEWEGLIPSSSELAAATQKRLNS
jgi:hypothetical protein